MAVVGSRAPPLDLSEIAKDDGLGLVKEQSTVGDLISFTERRISPVRQPRRRHSLSDADPPPTSKRRSSLLKSFTDRSSPVKNRRRSSTVSPNYEPDTTRRRTPRRDSLINVLREDLSKITCLKALKRFPSVQSDITDVGQEEVFSMSESDDERYSPNRRSRSRRLSSLNRRDSRRSLSSTDSTTGVLTDLELRKLRMIQTLNTMNGQTRHRPSLDSQNGELAILEASYGRGKKRGSIATHVLMKTRKRKEHASDINKKSDFVLGSSSPVQRRESVILNEEQKERAQNFFNVLKKTDKTKVGSERESPAKEETAKEVMLSFRRRLRRKKVKRLFLSTFSEPFLGELFDMFKPGLTKDTVFLNGKCNKDEI